MIDSFGGQLKDQCAAVGISVDCDGEGELVQALKSFPDPKATVITAFGGAERIARLKQHFEAVL